MPKLFNNLFGLIHNFVSNSKIRHLFQGKTMKESMVFVKEVKLTRVIISMFQISLVFSLYKPVVARLNKQLLLALLGLIL